MRRRLAFLLVLALLASTLAGCATNEPAAEPASIVDAKIDENGDLILFMSSGTTINAGYVRGAQGEDGLDGVDGLDGDSIASAYVDESGDLQLLLSDQRVVNAGHVQGADGRNGRDGADGQDGRDGKDGKDGEDGRDGIDGKDGKDGQDGKDGLNGQDGKDGADGQDGKDGEDGKDGITPNIGANGNWWIGDTDTGVQAGAGEEFIFDQGGKGTVLLAYVGSKAEVVIPEKCTQIAAGAFANNRIITSVVIPDSVTSIGQHAFDTCASLTSVKFPQNPDFTYIEEYAFNACGLREINLPDSVEVIDSYAFHSNPYLTKAQYSDQVRYIGECAFAGCSLSEVIIPSGRVLDHAFANWQNTSCRYPDSEVNGEHTFTSVEIPAGMGPEGDGIFRNCHKLTSVTWEGSGNNYGYLSISSGMFSGCTSLTDLTLPDNVKDLYIGDSAFASTAIEFAPIGGHVGERAFSNCRNIQSVVQVGSNNYSQSIFIGSYAFDGCTNLKNFTLSDTKEHKISQIEIDVDAFWDSGIENINLSAKNTIRIQLLGLLTFSESTAESLTLNAGTVDLGEYGLSLCDFQSVEINAYTLECGNTYGILSDSDNAIQTLTLNVTTPTTWSSQNYFPELRTLSLPADIRIEGFYHCPKLNTVILEEVPEMYRQTVWEWIGSIPELVCMSETPAGLDANLDNVGVIYVPDAAVEAYKAAEGWSEYAEKIRAQSARKPLKEARITGVSSEDVDAYIVGYKVYLDFPYEVNTESEFTISFADENGSPLPQGIEIYPYDGLSFAESTPGTLNGSSVSFHLATLPGGYIPDINDLRFILETEDALYATERIDIITRRNINHDAPVNPNDPKGIYFTETTKTIEVGEAYTPQIMGVENQTILTPTRLYVGRGSLGGIVDITEDNQVIGLKAGTAYIVAEYTSADLDGLVYTSSSMKIIVQNSEEETVAPSASPEAISDPEESPLSPSTEPQQATPTPVPSFQPATSTPLPTAQVEQPTPTPSETAQSTPPPTEETNT